MNEETASPDNKMRKAMLVAGLSFAFFIVVLVVGPGGLRSLPTDLKPLRTDYPPDFGTAILIIDPGHGGTNEGTESFWGLKEKNRNLAFAKALRDHLEKTGRWQVSLTRESDAEIPNSERPEIANREGPDLYISLHANGYTSKREGYSVIWYSAQELPASRRLAVLLASAMREAGFKPDMKMGPRYKKGANGGGSPEYQLTDGDLPVYVRERTDHRMIYPAFMPGVLLETHYLTNPSEAIRFSFDETLRIFCAAVEKALTLFLVETDRYPRKNPDLPQLPCRS